MLSYMDSEQETTNGNSMTFVETFRHHWKEILEQYGFPFGQSCVIFLYGLYKRITILNVIVFLLKYVPSGFYMYKLLKSVYETSRERIKQKQMELEDIQLQIQIVNTKLCVRDAEFSERAEQLRRSASRLRAVRARIRDMIDADEQLRRALDAAAAPFADDPELRLHSTPEEERDFIITLIKELKSERVLVPERAADKMDCGEHVQPEPSTTDSVYSSLSDTDNNAAIKDCRVKIIKVTNVYKVAYLKHYIKQKRLRRATQQASLKKKMEGIKALLEDWQKSLNAVINRKLLLESTPLDMASQEAMGDYSKPNIPSSDSESELKTAGGTDGFYDEYGSVSWTQNPYRSYPYGYEDMSDTPVCKDLYESQELTDLSEKYAAHSSPREECEREHPRGYLFSLPEETSSQVAIEEIKDEENESYLEQRENET